MKPLNSETSGIPLAYLNRLLQESYNGACDILCLMERMFDCSMLSEVGFEPTNDLRPNPFTGRLC